MTKRLLLAVLGFYRYWISPAIHALFPSGCKYQPTCSQYASEVITMYGAVRGGWMALRRLLRCHPFARGGFDPVPLSVEPVQLIGPVQLIEPVGHIHPASPATSILRDPLP